MTDEQLAREICLGLMNTGIEGSTSSVSCSTAGDYPSIGFNQWEGGRADTLLSYIDGGDRFIGRAYSDILGSGELEDLENLLGSPQGEEAQVQMSLDDALVYVEFARDAGLTDPRCIIYFGMWCPTSHYVCRGFVRSYFDSYDMNDLNDLCTAYFNSYASYADCEEYLEGYQNRAEITYEYLVDLDLGKYGIEAY